jgi:hypothetical protein
MHFNCISRSTAVKLEGVSGSEYELGIGFERDRVFPTVVQSNLGSFGRISLSTVNLLGLIAETGLSRGLSTEPRAKPLRTEASPTNPRDMKKPDIAIEQSVPMARGKAKSVPVVQVGVSVRTSHV